MRGVWLRLVLLVVVLIAPLGVDGARSAPIPTFGAVLTGTAVWTTHSSYSRMLTSSVNGSTTTQLIRNQKDGKVIYILVAGAMIRAISTYVSTDEHRFETRTASGRSSIDDQTTTLTCSGQETTQGDDFPSIRAGHPYVIDLPGIFVACTGTSRHVVDGKTISDETYPDKESLPVATPLRLPHGPVITIADPTISGHDQYAGYLGPPDYVESDRYGSGSTQWTWALVLVYLDGVHLKAPTGTATPETTATVSPTATAAPSSTTAMTPTPRLTRVPTATATKPVRGSCSTQSANAADARLATDGRRGFGITQGQAIRSEGARQGAMYTGTRKACVDIYVNNSYATNLTTDLMIGQPITLSVYINGHLAGRKDHPVWVLEGTVYTGLGPSVVGSYTADEQTEGAHVDRFSMENLRQPSFDLYFMKARGQWPTYMPSLVTVTTTSGHATTKLRIEAPLVHLLPSPFTTCHVDVNTTFRYKDLTPPTLGLGLNNRCNDPEKLTDKGIVWKFPVSVPNIGKGDIALTQLITRTVTFNGGACEPSWADERADVSTFVYNQLLRIGPGASNVWTNSDSPHIPLGGKFANTGDRFREEFSATDYLMYRPAVVHAIWVPIGTLLWAWSGEATYGGAFWRLFHHQDPQPRFSAQPPAWPEWAHSQPAGGVLTCP
jgi:hypothetical protein